MSSAPEKKIKKTRTTVASRKTKSEADPKPQEAPETFTLVLNRAHVYAVLDALELQARVLMGQFRHILEVGSDFYRSKLFAQRESTDFSNAVDRAEDLCNQLNALLNNLPANAYHGIYSKDTPEIARVAWDVQQVLRHALYWRRVATGEIDDKGSWMCVSADTPMQSSAQPLPVVVVVVAPATPAKEN